ncbi:MAG: 50S ribosomal protein L10 [Melioribacteraceae bacterium]|nr:50S ribosomal protein L10 [Melioribacteraceae bacterium]MCF8354655.1 50S ribosomal protein L10 [Melioribacteraceae bacterium]MCF8393557.1 50S ribosomal protein L10 [Melioribacteraceae bacterium]MCF8419367.1 50S ribosomal protein L10 [Melioribacteraceae bacterium]
MNKKEKAEVVAEIKELISNSTAMYLVDYSGVNVDKINQLRSSFRQEEVTYKVFKNTLFKKALEDNKGYEELNDLLVGMTGVAFAGENFVAPAKIIKKFFTDNQKFRFKGCYIEQTFYEENKLDTLASMPTKDEIMSSIVGSIAQPATGIVGAINAVMRDLVSVVDQISKREAA